MKIFYIDPNNSTPQLNYPLMESLDDKVDIYYLSSLNRKIDKDYLELYKFKKHDYFYFKIANLIKFTKLRQYIKAIEYPFNCLALIAKTLFLRPKIIHLNWIIIPVIDYVIIKILKKINNLSILITIHNFGPHEKRGLGKFEKKILNDCDSIIVYSKFIKRKLREITKTPIQLFDHGNGYHKIVSKYSISKLKNVDLDLIKIGFFGLIRPYKGVDLLIKAYDNFAQNTSFKTKLIIKGNIILDDENRILSLVNNATNLDNIEFHNIYLSNKDLITSISETDFIVLPYRRASQSGLTYLIYELKKPILATNVGGLPEYIDGKTSILCDPNIEGIEQGLRIIINKIVANEIPDNYQNYLKKKSFQNISRKYVSFYNSFNRNSKY